MAVISLVAAADEIAALIQDFAGSHPNIESLRI
jgi:hypothetical protein